MTTQHFIVATAGHVDHGKSALVKALTGTDPDRLPEEKARGITIDLGFAHLELQSSIPPRRASPGRLRRRLWRVNLSPATAGEPWAPSAPPLAGKPQSCHGGQASVFKLGIVDVPGHEDFVKTMVAGVGSIDLALLVVAADDGWMPQTEEHLQILTYLDVQRAVVALTKIDLVESGEAILVSRIREKLRDTPFADAPIIATSVIRGRGLDPAQRGINELKETLARVLADAPPQRDIGKPRLPVDRVFTLQGVGTVVTGTLTGGVFHRGQAVMVQPSGQPARIRTIQSYHRDVDSSGPGTRTALNLPDLAVSSPSGPTHGAEGIRRGDVVTLPELGGSSDTLDARLEISPRSAHAIKEGALVRVHQGTSNVPARVHFLSGDSVRGGQSAMVQLRLESKVFAFAGDRLIVRDWSSQRTLGGGVILDPDASGKIFRSEAHRKFLETRAQSPDQVVAYLTSQLARDGIAGRATLLLKSRFSALEISEAISRFAASGQVILAGDWVADAPWWQTLRRHAVEAIDTEHHAHPELTGLALSKLRLAVAEVLSSFPDSGVFDALLADLCRGDFVKVGAAIRRATHQPTLPPQLQAMGSRLRTALATKPLEPPSRKGLAPDSNSQQALQFLIETGEAVELGEEIVLLTENFRRATTIIQKFLSEHGPATVSELRQKLGTSRRVLVPLLERLDREGITLRQGDKRLLRAQP